ncbi:DUF4913 domain-containing protein [Kitasatospora sp. MY 5-36]|uniref:DUF4913 domain-containing protein n=1 Tax=Kitasatospora sp. MY 5-36 TaxID=1678027 RepID=UPI00067153C3|nr:DUF4913 domain-containing protein [Kitasatospora sp. MY 5-36]
MTDEAADRVLTEDVDDLKAMLQAVQAELRDLRESGSASAGSADHGSETPDDAEAEQEESTEWQYPPFLFLLEGEQRDAELRLLAEWVEGVLVPGCLGEASAESRWCHLWIEHWDAVGVLHAMWLAWQELTDPATCGYTGPSVWYRDHYRPHIADLRGPGGPFAGCTKSEHRTGHRLPGRVPSAWCTTEDDS